MSEYKVSIKTEQTGTGAKDAAADLGKVGDAAKSAGDKIKLNLGPDAFKITPPDPKPIQEHEKAVGHWAETVGGKLGVSRQDWREWHEIANAAGYGNIAMLGRMGVAFAALDAGFEITQAGAEKFFEALKEGVADEDRAEESSRRLGYTLTKITAMAALDASEHIKHLNDDFDVLKRNSDIAAAAAAAQAAAHKAVADALGAEAIALIQLQQVEGLVSEGDADRRIIRLKQEADLRNQAAENQKDDSEIIRNRNEAFKADDEAKKNGARVGYDASGKPTGDLSKSLGDINAAIEGENRDKGDFGALKAKAENLEAILKQFQDIGKAPAWQKFGLSAAFTAEHPVESFGINFSKGQEGVESLKRRAAAARLAANNADPAEHQRRLDELNAKKTPIQNDFNAAQKKADQAQKDADEARRQADDIEARENARKSQNEKTNPINAATADDQILKSAIKQSRREMPGAEFRDAGYNPNASAGANLEFDLSQLGGATEAYAHGQITKERLIAYLQTVEQAFKMIVGANKEQQDIIVAATRNIEDLTSAHNANLGQ